MRLLFKMDKKDHADCTRSFVRNSARSVIVSDKKVAMIHSEKYDYYKFPGGGIEAGEDPVAAMIRETREEAGLVIIPESVRGYGIVHRVQKSDKDPEVRFVQDNYYYLCAAEDEAVLQDLQGYEAEEGYTLLYVDPWKAIDVNRSRKVGETPYTPTMFEREERVLRMLIEEGYFDV